MFIFSCAIMFLYQLGKDTREYVLIRSKYADIRNYTYMAWYFDLDKQLEFSCTMEPLLIRPPKSRQTWCKGHTKMR